MFKRILFFAMMNIAVMLVWSIFIYILSFFGIKVNPSTYVWLFVFCLILGFTGSFISLFLSKWMAKKFYNIQLVTDENVSNLSKKERLVWEVVKDLSERNGIKMPEVGFYLDSEPNAFATWATKNSSLVAVSTGLMDLMENDAIEWVIGHEMAHILNWDMVTMTLLQWVLNTFVLFISKIIANIASQFVDEEWAIWVRMWVDLVMQIILGFLATFIAMWFSRYREFKADAGSAIYVWKEKMIAWLQALKDMQDKMHQEAGNKYATMQISTAKTTWIMRLLSSHPELEDRIKALKELKI